MSLSRTICHNGRRLLIYRVCMIKHNKNKNNREAPPPTWSHIQTPAYGEQLSWSSEMIIKAVLWGQIISIVKPIINAKGVVSSSGYFQLRREWRSILDKWAGTDTEVREVLPFFAADGEPPSRLPPPPSRPFLFLSTLICLSSTTGRGRRRSRWEIYRFEARTAQWGPPSSQMNADAFMRCKLLFTAIIPLSGGVITVKHPAYRSSHKHISSLTLSTFKPSSAIGSTPFCSNLLPCVHAHPQVSEGVGRQMSPRHCFPICVCLCSSVCSTWWRHVLPGMMYAR